MIAVLRSKLPLNSLWKVVGLVIALQWPVLADLNHDHDHDHEGLTSERTVCLSCSLIGTSSDADAEIDCFRSAQTASCLLYTSPSPRDYAASRMPSSA